MNAPADYLGIISDLDGVTYRGDTPIPSAVERFQRWNSDGIPYAFVTNNSTKTPQEFADKLAGMGIPTQPEQVVTSANLAVQRLSERLPAPSRVTVIGAHALREAVRVKGYELATTGVKAVVAGLDRGFTYETLSAAQTALLNGAIFIGTNPDRMIPHGDGFVPGAGSILSAIEAAAGVSPEIVGKPEPDLVIAALAILGTPPQKTLMIGDQLTTDIAAGKAAGLPTLLVHTGNPVDRICGITADFEVADLSEI